MKTILSQKLRLALIVLLLLVFTLNITQEAGAQTGSAAAGAAAPASPLGGGPVPGGPGYVAINAIDFRPLSPSTTASYAGFTISNPGASTGSYFTTFQIPNGATIKKMVVYYADEDVIAGMNLTVTLMDLPFGSGWGQMAIFSSSGSLSGWVYGQTTSISNPVVDLSIRSYAIEVDLPPSGGVALSGVRIDYGYQTNMPTILRP